MLPVQPNFLNKHLKQGLQPSLLSRKILRILTHNHESDGSKKTTITSKQLHQQILHLGQDQYAAHARTDHGLFCISRSANDPKKARHTIAMPTMDIGGRLVVCTSNSDKPISNTILKLPLLVPSSRSKRGWKEGQDHKKQQIVRKQRVTYQQRQQRLKLSAG